MSRRVFVAATAAAAGHELRSTPAATNRASTKRETTALRVAQIGMQGHYSHIIHGIPKIKDCQLVAVARSTPDEPVEKLKRFPAWNPQTRIYDDYRKMLDEIKPDVAAVFMPYARNSEANIEAVRRGCHVISEKPLAVTMDALELLTRERDHAGVRVTAILPMRLMPVFLAAHQAAGDGLIGEPVLVSAQKSYRWGTSRPGYYRRRKDYGGTIPWVAIHAIDFIRYVSGLEYANVTARHAVKVHKDYPECEDCGALLFEMTNGGQATLTFDYLRPRRAPSHGDDRLRVVGSKGIVEVRSTDKPFCELVTDEAPPRQLPLPESRKNVFADFVGELRGTGRHFLSPEDPFRATEVAIKARNAADTRSTISL